MADEEQVVDIQAELDGKVAETLEAIIVRFTKGDISVSRAAFGLGILFQATGGITCRKNFELISQTSKALRARAAEQAA